MNVLFVASAYPRHEADPITPWLGELIRRLHARGVGAEVLAPAYRGLGDHTAGAVRVHRFRYAPRWLETLTHDQTAPDRVRERPWFAALVPGYVAAGSLEAVRLARGGSFDVVHCLWPLPHGLIGLAAKRFTGVPLVSTFFGVELTWAINKLRAAVPVLRRVAERSDAVTAISAYTAAKVREVAPGVEPVVIPFGAAIEPLGDSAEQERGLGPAGAPSLPFRLLFVGRLVERKGVHVLLRALQQLRAAGRDIVLHVVGGGPEQSALQRLAAELHLGGGVRFLGAVDRDTLAAEFAGCDLFVLPAVVDAKGDTEGLGVVLLEAMTYSKPVLASEAGGISDIVRDGETGWLVQPGDEGALRDALARIAALPATELRQMARSGRAHAEQAFGWDGIVDRLVAVYEQVTGARA